MLVAGELLWRAGEETPRVTVRGVKPLAALAGRLRCRLTIDLAGPPALDALTAQIGGRRGGRGEVVVAVDLSDGRRARLLLGDDFAIDSEIAGQVSRLRGVASASLAALN